MTIAVLSSLVRPLVEAELPASVDARFYTSVEEMHELAPEAEIGWFDMEQKAPMIEAIRRAGKMRWLYSLFAGLDFLPLDELAQRGVTITNGAGINAAAVAEWAVMGMLVIAKDYRAVVESQQRKEWLFQPPGRGELDGARALILGYGEIGRRIGQLLTPFGVECVPVRRSGGEGALGPDEWREKLGSFDWVILALPATAETEGLMGAAEFAAMKPGAALVNIARGKVVDQSALVDALERKALGGALIDVCNPEPLPPDHPLWSLPNAHVTSHLSGRAQTSMFRRAAERFVANCRRYEAGQEVEPRFDPVRGY